MFYDTYTLTSSVIKFAIELSPFSKASITSEGFSFFSSSLRSREVSLSFISSSASTVEDTK